MVGENVADQGWSWLAVAGHCLADHGQAESAHGQANKTTLANRAKAKSEAGLTWPTMAKPSLDNHGQPLFPRHLRRARAQDAEKWSDMIDHG